MSTTAKKLVYTRDSPRLTFEQRCFYEKNGFIVFPRLVPLDLLEKCSKRFDDIASGAADKGVMTVMRDVSDRKAVNKIQDINHDEVLREYIEYNPMLDVVEVNFPSTSQQSFLLFSLSKVLCVVVRLLLGRI